jgi:hypothetical protein
LLSPGLLRYSTTDRWVREWNLALSRQQVDGLVSNQYDFALGVVAAYAAAVVVFVAAVAAAAAVVAAAVVVVAAAVVVVAAAVAVAVVAAAVAVVAAAVAVAAVVVVAVAAVAALDASFQCVLGLAHVDPEPRVLGGLVQVVFEALFPASRGLASLGFLGLSLSLCLYS